MTVNGPCNQRESNLSPTNQNRQVMSKDQQFFDCQEQRDSASESDSFHSLISEMDIRSNQQCTPEQHHAERNSLISLHAVEPDDHSFFKQSTDLHLPLNKVSKEENESGVRMRNKTVLIIPGSRTSNETQRPNSEIDPFRRLKESSGFSQSEDEAKMQLDEKDPQIDPQYITDFCQLTVQGIVYDENDKSSDMLETTIRQSISSGYSLKIPIITRLDELETIIGRCLLSTSRNQQSAKVKYQIRSNQIVINRTLIIPFSSIVRVAMINTQTVVYTLEVHYAIRKGKVSKSSNQIKTKSEVHTLHLHESYEFIYTIFAALVTRRIFIAESCRGASAATKSSQPKKTESLQSGGRDFGNMAVTSHLLGEDPMSISHLDVSTECFPEWPQTPIGSGYSIAGPLFKKSQYLKKWEQRFIQLSNKQFSSFRMHTKSEDCKKSIELKHKHPSIVFSRLSSIETKFQKLNGPTASYLVVRLKHGKEGSPKTDLGIPVANYSDIFSAANWLFGLATLMKKD